MLITKYYQRAALGLGSMLTVLTAFLSLQKISVHSILVGIGYKTVS